MIAREDMFQMARDAGFSDVDENGVWITDGYWNEELIALCNEVRRRTFLAMVESDKETMEAADLGVANAE